MLTSEEGVTLPKHIVMSQLIKFWFAAHRRESLSCPWFHGILHNPHLTSQKIRINYYKMLAEVGIIPSAGRLDSIAFWVGPTLVNWSCM